MECINGRMEIDMKESGETVLNMDKELTYLLTKILIQDIISLVNQMGVDNINGKMGVYILENLKMD